MEEQARNHSETSNQPSAQKNSSELPSQENGPQPPERPLGSSQAFPQGRIRRKVFIQDNGEQENRSYIGVCDKGKKAAPRMAPISRARKKLGGRSAR